jgi:formate C-acetyltransferase
MMENAWRNFKSGQWNESIDVRDFIQKNYTPYEGDDKFLAGPTERTGKIMEKVRALLAEEREKVVLDISKDVGTSILAHAPGYIDKENERIVGLQTDAPLKRAIAPNGGLRMVQNSLDAYGYTMDPKIEEIYTKYRKTHNQGVFDVYNPEIRACRSSHIITGLPDAYGRGRIIGDYRRVALYGIDFLVQQKLREKAELDDAVFDEKVIRLREELTEQVAALQELQQMAASYGFDISKPAATAKEAVQWTYFGYLAAVK